MRVTVARLPRPNVEQTLEVQDGATVLDILKRCTVPPDAAVVMRGTRPVPVDAPIADGDSLRIITVFSGG